ncbi:hypothetical protein [Limosilactobacillus galli]|uniref:hypothetical protein n=1 Tax=Limosilactobacillus galli TaxID=2991834 RepID=UPI0024BAD8D1|nr:hypothetical protein [Limosilactobacillus galli]
MNNDQLKRQNRLVIFLIGIIVVAGLAIHQYFNYSLKPVDPSSRQRVTVVIPAGATDHRVAKIMKEHHLVRSQFVFYYYLQTHKTHGVKAGKFRLARSATVPELAGVLQQNRAAEKR